MNDDKGYIADYQFYENFEATDKMKEDFDKYGYIVVRNLLDQEEVDKLIRAVNESDAFWKNSYQNEIGEKKAPRIIWSHPGNDITGIVARSEKVVNTCEKLLDGEVYHYHSKYMLKDPQMPAPHYWHQDYGYWYKCGNLFPHMMTVWVALDKAVKANGCMEILSGSNKCGRIEHHPFDGQYVGLKSRIEEIKKVCPHYYMEMNPGDALFFHCNTIHHSSANKSDLRRWAYIMTYNRASNNPTMVHHHPQYTPLEKVPNSAIKECTNYTDLSGKDFIHPDKNTTLRDLYKR